MGHRYFDFVLAGLLLGACAEAPPPEPVKAPPTYQDTFLEAEAKLEAGYAMGVMYIHPRRKRACNIINARISRKVYTGLEYIWEIENFLEIKEQRTAPEGRKHIGTHPVFFDMQPNETYRIDAISCEAYDKTITTQFQTFATFDAVPSKLSYIGDFTQSRLAEGVDLYVQTQDMDIAGPAIALDNAKLKAFLLKAEVAPFSFTNFDGVEMSAQQIIDNVGRSGDYFTLSQTLETQATEALIPFLSYLPDVTIPGPSPRPGMPSVKERTRDILFNSFDLALFRLDLHQNFQHILDSGKSYEVATGYIYNRLAVENTERRRKQTVGIFSESYATAFQREKVALDDYNTFIRRHRLKPLLKDRISEDRRNAREAWREQLERVPYVLTSRFSSQSDPLLRDRVQDVMNDYIPAKYDSLDAEFTAIAERQGLGPSEIRHLRRLLESTEAKETIIINELVGEFLSKNLAENEAYQKARKDYDRLWGDVFVALGLIQ